MPPKAKSFKVSPSNKYPFPLESIFPVNYFNKKHQLTHIFRKGFHVRHLQTYRECNIFQHVLENSWRLCGSSLLCVTHSFVEHYSWNKEIRFRSTGIFLLSMCINTQTRNILPDVYMVSSLQLLILFIISDE